MCAKSRFVVQLNLHLCVGFFPPFLLQSVGEAGIGKVEEEELKMEDSVWRMPLSLTPSGLLSPRLTGVIRNRGDVGRGVLLE